MYRVKDRPRTRGRNARTCANAFLISCSRSVPRSNTKTLALSWTNGSTLAKIKTAMKMEARGSKPVQPYRLMRMVEMMTPTEPSVSAMTCKKTPFMLCECPCECPPCECEWSSWSCPCK